MNKKNQLKALVIIFFVLLGGVYGLFFSGDTNETEAKYITTSSSCNYGWVCNGGSSWTCNPSWLNCPGNHSKINCDNYSTCVTPFTGSVTTSCYHWALLSCSTTYSCHYIKAVNTWSECSGGVQVAVSVTWATKGGQSCSDVSTTRLCSTCGNLVCESGETEVSMVFDPTRTDTSNVVESKTSKNILTSVSNATIKIGE